MSRPARGGQGPHPNPMHLSRVPPGATRLEEVMAAAALTSLSTSTLLLGAPAAAFSPGEPQACLGHGGGQGPHGSPSPGAPPPRRQQRPAMPPLSCTLPRGLSCKQVACHCREALELGAEHGVQPEPTIWTALACPHRARPGALEGAPSAATGQLLQQWRLGLGPGQ